MNRCDPGELLAILALTVLAAVLFVAIARAAEPIAPAGDIALTESYVFHAIRGDLFLGPYSRLLWHHPGPLYFFVLAPFYILSGYRTSGLAAAAVTINLTAFAVLVWLIVRKGRAPFAVTVTALGALYCYRLGLMLASPWNPHVLLLPTLTLLALAAAVAADSVWWLPAVACLASFELQTHLGLVPTVSVVIAASVALARPPRWLAINVSLWILLLLWFLPLAEQVSHTPGNLTKLWTFFAYRGEGQPFRAAFEAWAAALVGPVTPRFSPALGGALAPRASIGGELWAVAQVVLVGMVALVERRRRSADPGARFQAMVAVLLCLASIAALWSVTRIAGDILDHEVFWISGLGLMNVAVLVDFVIARARAPLKGVRHNSTAAPLNGVPYRSRVPAVCAALMLVPAALGVVELRRVNALTFRPGDQELAAGTLAEAIVKYAGDEGRPKLLLQIDGPAWGVAAGVVVQLQKAGLPFAVSRDAVWMFSEATAPRGDEARTIAISAAARHEQLLSTTAAVTLAARRNYFADLITP
jgi:hypothetical protein